MRIFSLFYLIWVAGFFFYDLYVGTYWALFQLAFLPVAIYWFWKYWIRTT